MMGAKTPAARAVVEGMAGESTASAVCKPYASFRVVEPNARTKRRPRRSPKPVLMKARAKKVATTMSQMTSLVASGEALLERERAGRDGHGERHEGPGADGRGLDDEARDGGAEDGEEGPCLGGEHVGDGEEEAHGEADADGDRGVDVVHVVGVDGARGNAGVVVVARVGGEDDRGGGPGTSATLHRAASIGSRKADRRARAVRERRHVPRRADAGTDRRNRRDG